MCKYICPIKGIIQSIISNIKLYAYASGQLAWLVYLIGSVVGGRISHTSADDFDSMDGQLICRYVCQSKYLECSVN